MRNCFQDPGMLSATPALWDLSLHFPDGEHAPALGIQSSSPCSTPHHFVPVGFLSLVALNRIHKNHVTLAPKNKNPHRSFSCAARANSLSFTQAWERQTSTRCVHEPNQLLSKLPKSYLGWGKHWDGRGSQKKLTSTTWFKDSSNFQLPESLYTNRRDRC